MEGTKLSAGGRGSRSVPFFICWLGVTRAKDISLFRLRFQNFSSTGVVIIRESDAEWLATLLHQENRLKSFRQTRCTGVTLVRVWGSNTVEENGGTPSTYALVRGAQSIIFRPTDRRLRTTWASLTQPRLLDICSSFVVATRNMTAVLY